MRIAFAAICTVAMTWASVSVAEVHFRQNRLHQTIELSGLYADSTCERVPIRGTVVKRQFAQNALDMTGFVYQRPDGTRQFVNVDTYPELDSVTQDIIANGFQRLLKVGRILRGWALECGVSGRVFSLEQIE